MAYKLGTRSLKSLDGVHPTLIQVVQKSITDSPVDFTIVEGVRTLVRQRELYAQGRTKAGKIVTNADGVRNKSNHQARQDGYGYAIDLYPFFNGQVQVSHKDTIPCLKRITDHIKATAKTMCVAIECGIDWRSPYDPPHIQLKA
jgi:peptidoglycan L-alanyl-D-glutamate endopeptidase CwlK